VTLAGVSVAAAALTFAAPTAAQAGQLSTSLPAVAPVQSPLCLTDPQLLPQVTLSGGVAERCGAPAGTGTSTTPSSPQACATPVAGNWCPSWVSGHYDGPGHRTDAPGNAYSTHVMGVSGDGRLTFVAGTSDRNSSGSANYQAVTIAYDTATGATVWTVPYATPTGDESFAQALAAAGSRVFVSVLLDAAGQPSTSSTTAYDADTGTVLWSAQFGGSGTNAIWASAAAGDGSAVYVNGSQAVALPGGGGEVDATTVAYDGATGGVLWTAAVPAAEGFGVDVAAGRVAMAAAQFDTQGDMSQADVMVVDAATGTSLGTGHLSLHADDAAGLIMSPDGSRAFIGFQDLLSLPDGNFYDTMTVAAFDGASGQALWKRDYIGPNNDSALPGFSYFWFWRPLAVAPDGSRVYGAGVSSDGNFGAQGTGFTTLAFDAATGAQLWASSFNTDTPVTYVGIGPQVAADPAGGALYVTGEANQATTFANLIYGPTDGALRQAGLYTDGTATATGLAVSGDGAQVFIAVQTGSPSGTTINYDILTLGFPGAGSAVTPAVPEYPWAGAALLLAAPALLKPRFRRHFGCRRD
jgi:outer membrane protein assembly factor BamB